ncbi:MAG: aldo/keto reductase [Oscillospiraceae bacterium]|nr:aldo/keto reductase [Oscillospiraceae bacterium]
MKQLLHGCNQSDQAKAAYCHKLLALYDLADELNLSITELAIGYILSFDDIHVHIPGAREVTHLIENLNAASKGALSGDIVGKIDDIQRI